MNSLTLWLFEKIHNFTKTMSRLATSAAQHIDIKLMHPSEKFRQNLLVKICFKEGFQFSDMNQNRLDSFWNFSGRGITGIVSIPSSTFSSSNGTEIILFRNKSSESFLMYHHCSSYSTSRDGIDRIDEILFQLYLFQNNTGFLLQGSRVATFQTIRNSLTFP